MKKYFVIGLAIIMVLPILVSCSLTEKGELDNPDVESITMDSIVAEVGDNRITLREYYNMFETCRKYVEYYGQSVTADAETLYSFQDDVLNMLLQNYVVKAMAEKLGYDKLNDDQQAELDKRIEEEHKTLYDYYYNQAANAAIYDDSIDIEEHTRELIMEEARSNTGNPDITYEEYLDFLGDEVRNSYYAELMKAGELTDVNPTDDKVFAEFTSLVESDTKTYTDSPEDYKDFQEDYESTGTGTPVMYVPEGYSRIYDIYIPHEGELPDEYYDNIDIIDELKEQYMELSFEDAVNGTDIHTDEIVEIIEKYKTLKSSNDALYSEYAADAKAKIEDIYAKLQAGADVYELMLANTANANVEEGTMLTKNGLLISTKYESTYDWGEKIKSVFGGMKPGEFSEPIEMEEDGYHIIYYISDEKAGPKEYDDVYESVYNKLRESDIDAEWSALLNDWLSSDMVIKHTEVYRIVGDDAMQAIIDADTKK